MTCTFRIPLTMALLLAIGGTETVSAQQSREITRIPASPNQTVDNAIGMTLTLIPAGKFTMGSPLDEPERDDEEVPHEVVITQPFLMGIHEVTQEQYAQVMGEAPKSIFNQNRGGGPQHPADNVLWEEATSFCEKLSKLAAESKAGRVYRLPTEAEWEYACRAGTSTPFFNGSSLSAEQANFNGKYPYGDAAAGKYLAKTTPVGSYEPNAFGLYDMHGNVSEYCADWYDRNYYRDSPAEDPFGPPLGLSTNFGTTYVVIRGGCWLDDARACRSAYRFRAMPKNRYRLIGFRVVADMIQE